MTGCYRKQEFMLGTARIKPYHDFSMVFGFEVQAKERHGKGWVYLERFKFSQEAARFRNSINSEDN